MENQALLEKADTLANLVEQMFLAHMAGDEQMFKSAHEKASQLGFDLVNALQETKSPAEAGQVRG